MRNNLYTLLKADEKQTRKIVIKTLKANGYKPVVTNDFIYAEGTIPVLLIAHYDTYATSPRFIRNDRGILSGWVGGKQHQLGADDRAGIYAILETIQKHHCHVLFTGGEERGGVGATAFTKSGIKPDVNYCLQFDRRGSNDAVYYEGDNEKFEKFITSHGWKTETGSFTDICTVCPYLDVAGVNLSIGYYNEHTTSEVLDTATMNANIKRIPELLDGEKFDWVPALWYTLGRAGWYDDYDWFGSYHNVKADDKNRYYIVDFYDENGEADFEDVIGSDYFSAIGYFLTEHPTLTFRHIVGCVPVDEYDDYEDFEDFEDYGKVIQM